MTFKLCKTLPYEEFSVVEPHPSAVFRIRIQLNPDPAKNLNPDVDPEDLGSGSGSKLFLNTLKKNKITGTS